MSNSSEKMRVYELAKLLSVSSKELEEYYEKEGIEIKSHMSYVGPYEIRKAKEFFNYTDDSEEQKLPLARVRKRARARVKTPPVKEDTKKEVKNDDDDIKTVKEKKKDVKSAEEKIEKPVKEEHTKTPVDNIKKKQEIVSNKETEEPKEKETAKVVKKGRTEKEEALFQEELLKKKAKKAAKTKIEKEKNWKKKIDWEEVEVVAEKEIEKEKKAPEKEKKKVEPKRRVSWAEVMKKNKSKKSTEKKEKKEKEEKVEKLYLMKGITYKDFAESIGMNIKDLTLLLEKEGIEVEDFDESIEEDYANIIAEEYGKELVLIDNFGDDLLIEEFAKFSKNDFASRPPVVTIMGHVDHGKTSILDYIRKSRITAKEFGGITQHIGAYSVKTDKGEITFIDTPGHEAFTAMRARGANITDIVVLVVAANDSVMPQTIEAINHAKAAGVPIVVAVNKIDIPGAKPDKVKQDLSQYNIIPEEWGGENLFVNCSARTGEGIDELLDMILLQAEMLDLKAIKTAPARGVVIESKSEKGKGNVASVLIKEGTLRVGETFVVGTTWGRTRMIIDSSSKRLKELTPGKAAQITGLEDLPDAGDAFAVIKNEKKARYISEKRKYYEKRKTLVAQKSEFTSLEDLFEQISEGEKTTLNLILKADTRGTLEAIMESINNISVEEVDVSIVHTGIGMVTENDVNLAITSKSIIIAFNVRSDNVARKLAEERGIQIRNYNVIYKLMEDLQLAIEGLLAPEMVENYLGSAEVRQVFRVPKIGTVAGCYVKDGKVIRNGLARLVRDGQYIWEGKLASLQRFKDSVKEVAAGYECGIGLENYNDIKEGDIIETYEIEEHERHL